MITFHTLASSSAGNCMLISDGETHLLVDAGISCRRISAQLAELHLTIQQLSAILVTHNHVDHIGGCDTLMKKTNCSLFASVGTGHALKRSFPAWENRIQSIPVGQSFVIGGFSITACSTLHDAPDSVGYRIDHEDGSIGILTDTGHVPQAAHELMKPVQLLVLESNYDEDMLMHGPYPYPLKLRIQGDHGHLSNVESAAFSLEMVQENTQAVVLAHLSKDNNCPETALKTTLDVLQKSGKTTPVFVAPRDTLSQEFCLCKKSLSFA